MHPDGDILGQGFLQGAGMRCFGMSSFQLFYFFFREQGEYANEIGRVLIGSVQPVLVKLVGRGLLRIEPYIATLRLAKLAAICLFDQRSSHGKSLTATFSANELSTRHDVAPLIGATHL